MIASSFYFGPKLGNRQQGASKPNAPPPAALAGLSVDDTEFGPEAQPAQLGHK
jgi:hypothetical protein